MSRPPAQHHTSFSVVSIAAWAPGVTTESDWAEWHRGTREIASSGEPALQQMQPLLRRHAGRLGRLACSVGYDALAGQTDIPVVFSSRYGEVSRSVELLSALAAHEELSPASFGLSVHNAITGLFSMARKDTANSIALAAGDDSAEYGVIEACSLLADGAPLVLLVVADVPLPSIYAAFADTAPEAFAWACLLSSPASAPLCLEWEDTTSQSPELRAGNPRPSPGALAVLPFLQGHETVCVRDSGTRRWRWRHHD
jgi:Beta-ketoacyl synthase, N-terminal domain